jgi:outer membrane protein TolC
MGKKGIIGVSCIAILLFGQIAAASAELLSLSDGLKLVTENSRLVKISRGDEKISEADTLIERSRLFPTVNGSASGTMLAHEPHAIFGTQSVPVSQKDFYAYNLTIQQTLFDFWESASLYESSKARLEAKRLDTARVKNLAAIDFAMIYFDLLESEKMVAVGEKEVERLESHLRDAKNLYEEGVITRNDLLQAEVRLSDSRQRLLTSKTNRELNASRLNSALVRPLTEKVEIMDVKEAPPVSEATNLGIARAWEEAEKDRPEIRIVDSTLRSLDLDEEAKKAEFYPKVIAVGSYDYTKNRYMTPQGNWEMTLGLGINIFSGWKTTAEVAKIRYQKDKLLEQRNKLVDDVRLEVEKYLLDARTARDRVDVTRDAVRQAEENLRINNARYTEGVGTATEVLDAVTLLTVAETNHYRSVYDLAKAEIAVLYAIGKDLAEVYR